MSRKKTFDEFLLEAKLRHPNSGYKYDSTTYVNTHTPMRIICPIHGEFWVTPKSHLLYECKKCSYLKRAKNYTLTTEEFINKAKQKHGNKYDYSKSIYVGTKIPLIIICPKHGEFLQQPNMHLCGEGCPKCNSSKLEIETEMFLNKCNINYISQYKTDWLGKQSLDFYLPDYNIAIECQGKQHFGVGGWSKNFDIQKMYDLDLKKYNLCLKHNINIYYFVSEKNKTIISDDIIYKNNIYFDLNDILKKIVNI